MSGAIATARNELVALRRERLPMTLLVVFVAMVTVSSFIGWLTNSTVSDVWRQTSADGLTSAPNPFANVSPLFYARNSVIYVVLIGALMSIVVGVSSTMRDRKARTVDLVMSHPISIRGYLGGKLIGIALWLAIVLVVATAISWASISVIVRQPLTWMDSVSLIGFYSLAFILLMVFVVIGMLSGIYSTRETTALLVPISLWSIVAFVLPQVGTSANPVSLLNPVPAVVVPGGAFDTLNSFTHPMSITEQFKVVSGSLLADPNATGNVDLALVVITTSLAIGVLVLMTTSRNRIRGALHE